MENVLNNLASFGEGVKSRVLESVEKIKAGSKFNGIFYKDRDGRLNIYVDGNLVSLYKTKTKDHLVELEEIFVFLLTNTIVNKNNKNLITELSDFHKLCEGQD
jgi:hypothetical protein